MTETKRQFTLLLVDDNPTNLLLLVKIIELDLPEVRMLTAPSAIEGLALAERETIDGAFIDVQMPQMDGLEMCRRLRELPHTANIPLVLMTAHVASPKMRADGLEVGAYDFISQPISNVEMLARIKVMLRLCTAEQQATKNTQQLQQQVTEHADRLRWISGLLISGNGSLEAVDQRLLYQLVNELPDPATVNPVEFFEALVTKFPLPWRRTLMKLALLEKIPVALAQKLSEIPDVAAVFDYLSRHQLSQLQTFSGDEYIVLKPDVKALLGQRAEQNLSRAERVQVSLLAADWYQQKNNYLASLKCLVAAQQYSAVSQLIGQLGLTLLTAKNRIPLFAVLRQIPEKQVSSCGWLSLFRGIDLLQQQSLSSGQWLDNGYCHFEKNADNRGKLLTLAQQARLALLVDGSYNVCAQNLPLFRQLATEQLVLLEPAERLQVANLLGFAELFWGAGFAAVEDILTVSMSEAQHLQLPEQQLELNFLRAASALREGRYLIVKTALEQALKFVPAAGDLLEAKVLQLGACELLHANGDLSGLLQQQQQVSYEQGIKVGVYKPLVSFYIATLWLARGNHQRALEEVEIALLDGETITNFHQQSRLFQLRGLINALLGREQKAIADCEKGLQLRQQAGCTLGNLENLLFAGASCYVLKQYAQAEEYLTAGLKKSHEFHEERLRGGFYAWLGVVQQRLRKRKKAGENIAAFMEQLRRQKINYFWGMVPELMNNLLPLLTSKQQLQIQPFLAEQMFATVTVKAKVLPLLKVSCLGKFRLELENNSFAMSQVGQASRQILALLIVTPNRSISIELLMEMVWPDSPPRKARSSFDTAHSRLRKALEETFGKTVREDYLILEKGMLILKHCWIDSVVLIETMNKVRYYWQRKQFWQAEQALWKINRLWQGNFLSGYDLDGELPLLREQLKQMRLEQLVMLAGILRQRQQEKGAIQMLCQGLLLESTYDPIIKQLLELYRQQQDNHAVDVLLDKYRTALQQEDYEADEIADFIEILNN